MSGFTKPTTTQTPDALFDYWLTRLTGSEMRVLLYAIRRTFGFGKESDAISLNQFLHGITTQEGRVLDEGTGISRPALLTALKKLTAQGLLIKTRQSTLAFGDQASVYRVAIEDHRYARTERGFRSVNTTQVPDELFDYWLPRLSDAELKVLLYIVRRTLGFRKRVDGIRPRQFLGGVVTAAGRVLDDGCGLSERHMYAALGGLRDKGLIAIERRRHHRYGNIASLYGLIFEDEWPAIVAEPDPREQPDAFLVEQRAHTTSPNSRRDDGWGALRGSAEDDTRQAGRSPTEEREEREERKVWKGGRIGQDGRQRAEGREANDGGKGGRQGTEGESQREGTYAPKFTPQQADSQDTVITHTGPQQTETHKTDQSKLSRGTGTYGPGQGQRDGPAGSSPARPYSEIIASCIEDWSREFHDAGRFIQNRTRVLRMWSESALNEDTFLDLMYEARRRTKRALVRKDATDATSAVAGTKNRMPYFFAVLDDLILDRTATAIDPGPADSDNSVTGAQAIWHAVLDELRALLTSENYETWLSQTRALERDGNLLRVGVPKELHRDWLRHKLGGRIAGVLQRLGYESIQVEYILAPPEVRLS